MVDHIGADLARELGWTQPGASATNWTPGEWTNAPGLDENGEEEYQPELPEPHIPTYDHLKKHKHYGQYFRPHRYRPFPAWMYHRTQPAKLVRSKEDVVALGPEWSEKPFEIKPDMTGKALPVETDMQRMTRVMMEMLSRQNGTPLPQGGAIDPNMIAGIVAAVMAATQAQTPAARSESLAEPPAWTDPAPLDIDPIEESVAEASAPEVDTAREEIERRALIELAEKEGIKIDRRWNNDNLKKALGL